MGLFDVFNRNKEEKLEKTVAKTKDSLLKKISRAVVGKAKVDDEILDELEEILIGADVGIDTTVKIIKRLEERVAKDKYLNTNELNNILRDEIKALIHNKKVEDFSDEYRTKDGKPYVIMVVGVNGVGKTTTIGKLAYKFKQAGKKVLLGASDTFRAAAIEQLEIWAQRAGVDIVKQHQGSDPAAVAYDTLNSAIHKGYDIVIIDTAGRLHNKKNLMEELGKIKRVMQKLIPEAPHEVLLVLDASTGQNAFQQAKEFTKVTDVDAIALTKLDGTAKGGVVIGISDQFKIPIKFIGTGEKIDDIQIFDPDNFIDSLFSKKNKTQNNGKK